MVMASAISVGDIINAVHRTPVVAEVRCHFQSIFLTVLYRFPRSQLTSSSVKINLGSQPMESDFQSLVIFKNSEILNKRLKFALRAIGHSAQQKYT